MQYIFRKLKAIWNWVFEKTPYRLLFLFWPLSIAIRYYRFSRVGCWRLYGQEASSLKPLVFLYCGIATNKNYVANLAYGKDYQEQYLGNKWIWQFKQHFQSPDNSLIITEAPNTLSSWFSKSFDFYIPGWIEGELNLPKDLLSFTKSIHSLNHDRNLITRNQLHYEVVEGLPKIYDFYHNMYLPYISQAHEDRSIIESYSYIKKMLGKSSVLFIKKEDVAVAGCLFRISKNIPRLLILGVKDGNRDYVKKGALVAIYYFAFSYLLEKGYTTVNLGKTRAFLNDGVLNYKNKWGLKVIGLSETGFMLKVLSVTDGVKAFLSKNPFVFKDNQVLKSAFFSSKTELYLNMIFRDFERPPG